MNIVCITIYQCIIFYIFAVPVCSYIGCIMVAVNFSDYFAGVYLLMFAYILITVYYHTMFIGLLELENDVYRNPLWPCGSENSSSAQLYVLWWRFIPYNTLFVRKVMRRLKKIHDEHLVMSLILRLVTIIILAIFSGDEVETNSQALWHTVLFISHILLAMSWYTKPVNLFIIIIWLVMFVPFALLFVINLCLSTFAKWVYARPKDVAEPNIIWFKAQVMDFVIKMNFSNSKESYPMPIGDEESIGIMMTDIEQFWKVHTCIDDWRKEYDPDLDFDNNSEPKSCMICFEIFERYDRVVTPNCPWKLTIHLHCMQKWVEKKEEWFICRTRISDMKQQSKDIEVSI